MIKKSVVALMAVLPVFTACQSDPEVGTLLHPVEQENTDPKIYINEVSAPTNTAIAEVVQTPVSLVLPEDDFSFYVRLNRPVESDVTVTLGEDATLAAAYGNDYAGLPVGALDMVNATVTIPAGKMVSSEPVTFKVADSETVKAMEGKGVAALAVTNISSKAKVALGADHNAYYTLLSKKVTNFKDFNSATLESKTLIPAADLKMTFNGSDVTATLTDDNTRTYVYMSSGPDAIIVEFNDPQPLVGLSYRYGYSANYGPYVVNISTSNDGNTWTSQTGGELVAGYTSGTKCINFYAPITCKYVKFYVPLCFYGQWYDSYNTPCVGVLNLYK